jgi:large subunit ribosomal protein L35e
VRKAIARVLTVLSEKRITQARDAHKKDKHAPKDLRMKKTRAFRKKLTQHEAKKMTLRQQKKTDNFKVRKYALIA